MNKLKNWQFLVVEGIDGSGKSTIAKKIFDELKGAAALFCEPTENSPHRTRIRAILAGDEGEVDDEKNSVLRRLFLEDRVWNIKNNLEPAIQRSKKVILDRYFFSTAAYQGKDETEARGIAAEYLTLPEILMPDVVLYIDIAEETALDRLNARAGHTEVFEKLEFLKKVHKNYNSLFTSTDYEFPIRKIDGAKTPEEVWLEVSNIIF
ncbi:MAG: dTMP kinase [Leptospirales bacterium]